MPFRKMIICEICGKEEWLDNPMRDKWYIENISHQICSKKCFEKQIEGKDDIQKTKPNR